MPGRPPLKRRTIGESRVALSATRLGVGLVAVLADKSLRVRVHQASGVTPLAQPCVPGMSGVLGVKVPCAT
jgi:hypothetical protein